MQLYARLGYKIKYVFGWLFPSHSNTCIYAEYIDFFLGKIMYISSNVAELFHIMAMTKKKSKRERTLMEKVLIALEMQ